MSEELKGKSNTYESGGKINEIIPLELQWEAGMLEAQLLLPFPLSECSIMAAQWPCNDCPINQIAL